MLQFKLLLLLFGVLSFENIVFASSAFKPLKPNSVHSTGKTPDHKTYHELSATPSDHFVQVVPKPLPLAAVADQQSKVVPSTRPLNAPRFAQAAAHLSSLFTAQLEQPQQPQPTGNESDQLIAHPSCAGIIGRALVPFAHGALALQLENAEAVAKKPSLVFRKEAGLDPDTGLTRYFDDNSPVRVQDFFDNSKAHATRLLMIEGPTNVNESLAVFDPTSGVSDAVITNILIAIQKPSTTLILDNTALDDDRLKPAVLLLANAIDNYKAADALIIRGSSVQHKSAHQQNPLHLACENGHFNTLMRLLEEAHAGIDERTYRGGLEKVSDTQSRSIICQYTPLMLAVINQHRECVILMIMAGANLEKGDQYNRNAQAHAQSALDLELKKVPQGDIKKAAKIIQLLKNHDYIERFLNESEIELLKKYFFERYPALASTDFPIQVQVIICRYLGFARWDNAALLRAFRSTGDLRIAKALTPESSSTALIPAQEAPQQVAQDDQILKTEDQSAIVDSEMFDGTLRPLTGLSNETDTSLPAFSQEGNGIHYSLLNPGSKATALVAWSN